MIKFAREGGKQVQKEDFSEENVSLGRDTGDTNPKLLVNGYRLVSLSQWSPAPLSLVINEQETHQCEAIVVRDQKSCRNFDLRAGRSWRGCRDR